MPIIMITMQARPPFSLSTRKWIWNKLLSLDRRMLISFKKWRQMNVISQEKIPFFFSTDFWFIFTVLFQAAAKSLQSCLTLCDPVDSSLPGSSVHGIFQARVLEWGAIAFSLIPSYWNLIYSTNLKLNNVLCKLILLYFQQCLNFKSRNATHLLSLPYALAWAIASRWYINLDYILQRK